jgi:hypothetical protein
MMPSFPKNKIKSLPYFNPIVSYPENPRNQKISHLDVFNPSLTITYKDLSQISQACENLRGYRPSQVAPDLRWRGGRVEFRKCVRPQI